MAKSFCLFAEKFIETKTPINIANAQKFPVLTFNQRGNFQKLQYWEIVYRNELGYFLTEKGEQFYYGEISIPKKVATMENEVLSYNHQAWDGEKRVENVYIWQILQTSEAGWKQRPEYQREASLQTAML